MAPKVKMWNRDPAGFSRVSPITNAATPATIVAPATMPQSPIPAREAAAPARMVTSSVAPAVAWWIKR